VWQELIQIQGPYNFDRVLERLSLDPLQVIDHNEKILKIPLWMNEKPVVMEIKSTGTIDHPTFIISSRDKEMKREAIKRVAHLLQWNTPLQPIHQHFMNTDLRDIFQSHYGTPLVLDSDPYNCVVKCIIHQQLNLTFAHKLTERFVKEYGFEQEGVWFYPRPEKIAKLTVEELRNIQFSGRKAEYVITISQAIVDGHVNLDSLKEHTNDEIYSKLIKWKGIGPWTIQNLLMFGYGKVNLFPSTDIGIQNALKRVYQLDRKPTLAEIEEYKINWEPYLSYASLYLWRSIEQHSA
jgi:DNA-3-methyladenine glycosylase II